MCLHCGKLSWQCVVHLVLEHQSEQQWVQMVHLHASK